MRDDDIAQAGGRDLVSELDSMKLRIAQLERAVLRPGVPELEGERGRWLPVKTVSIDTGYSESCLRKWAKDGLIATRMVGGRKWIDVDSLPERARVRICGLAALDEH